MGAKKSNPRSKDQLLSENEDLRARLAEAEETLRAIREGEVDAVVVSGRHGEQVFSLTGAEAIYRQIVETMTEAALTVSLEGTVLFTNSQFSELLGRPAEQIIGHPLSEFIAPKSRAAAEALLVIGRERTVRQRLVFQHAGGETVPAHISAHLLAQDGSPSLCVVATDLTELENSAEVIQQLRRQRRALGESERRERDRAAELAALLDAAPTPVFIAHDPDCRHITGNRAADELLRNPSGAETSLSAPSQARPRHFRPVKDGRELSTDMLPAQRSARGETVSDFEFSLVFDDGSVRHVVGYGTPLLDGGGRPRGAVHVLVDITKRKQAEEALRRGKELSDALNRINKTVHSTFDFGEVVQRLIAEGAQALGSETAAVSLRQDDGWTVSHVHGLPAELVGARMTDDQERHAVLAVQSGQVVAIGDASDDERFNREHFREHDIHAVLAAPLIVRSKPLGAMFFNYHSGPRTFSDAEMRFARQLAATASVAMDNARLFEDLRHSEEALRANQERLALASSATGVGIFEWHVADGTLVWTQTHEALFGYGPPVSTTTTTTTTTTEHDYRHWADRVHPDDLAHVEDGARRSVRDREPLEIEYRIIWPDGSLHWIDTRGIFVPASGSTPGRMLGVAMDITERKEAEAAMETSERRYRSLFEAVDDGLALHEIICDEQGRPCDYRFLEVNHAFEQMTGLTRKELVGRTQSETLPDEDPKWLRLFGDVALNGRSRRFQKQSAVTGRLFEGIAYSPTAGQFAGLFTDITERKHQEEALRQAKDELEDRVRERTAELHLRAQQLARLTSELTMAEQRERQHLAQVLHDGLQQLLVAARFRLNVLEMSENSTVKEEAAALGELISDSIETSRSLTAELSPPVLKSGLVPALEWLARWMEEKYGLAVDLDAPHQTGPTAENVTVLLFQAARELLFNVVKHAGAKAARVEVQWRDHEVTVSVVDEGRGFDPQQLRHVDKQEGGLGLFAIRERVELMGGQMAVDSAIGRGTRMTLVVPVKPAETGIAEPLRPRATVSASVASPEAAATSTEGQLRIALIDDHAVVRQGLATLLRREKQFQIVGEASDGKSAIELVRRLQPDVVLMDISMPGMNGIEATKIIQQEHPEVCVIGLSMHDDAHAGEQIRQAGAAAYLNKSGPVDAIVQAVLACRREGK